MLIIVSLKKENLNKKQFEVIQSFKVIRISDSMFKFKARTYKKQENINYLKKIGKIQVLQQTLQNLLFYFQWNHLYTRV
jgi:hypothetical protein